MSQRTAMIGTIFVMVSMMALFVTGFHHLHRTPFYRATTSTRTSRRSPVTSLFAKKQSTTRQRRTGEFWEARMEDCFRPTINDVERISWGKPAKQKGTGSRGVPHRLNQEERLLFEQARRKGFLEIAGSGWRSQRREAPLLNTFRSLCDARGQASVILHKDKSGIDELVVDISPLRNESTFGSIAEECLNLQPDGQIIFQLANDDASATDKNDNEIFVDAGWETRPIYQLTPYLIVWKLPRAQAKALGKKMANAFDTVEGGKAGATDKKKPIHVKPGKGRRHGGYGIG